MSTTGILTTIVAAGTAITLCYLISEWFERRERRRLGRVTRGRR